MARFEAGTKVRVNEGELEGVVGTVVVSIEHSTIVAFDLLTGAGSLALHTEMLVSADQEHPALKAVKLYPDRLKEGYVWRLTTYVGGVTYVSRPMTGEMVKSILKTPPSGLEEVDYAETTKIQHGGWKAVWQD